MSQKHINFCSLDLVNTKNNLNNLIDIYNFLDGLYSLNISMVQIHKPVLVPYYYGKVHEDCGVSCFSVFDGGYLTLHIFEKRNIAYFDVMSCVKFDENKFVNEVCKFCGTKNVNLNTNLVKSNSTPKSIFGPHFIAEGKLKKKFGLENLISLLNEIIKKIGMTPIINPNIIQQKNSVMLFILIAESHIALTLKKDTLKIDIFSCKMFDCEKLEKILNKHINLKNRTLYYRLSKI